MKRILTLSGSFLIIFITASLTSLFLLTIVMLVVDDPQFAETDFYDFLFYCLSFTITIVGCWLFKTALKLDMPTFVPQFRKLNLPMIVATFIVVMALGIVLDPLLKLLPDVGMDLLYEITNEGVWTIVCVVIAAPILEEYLFRGVMQRTLIKSSSPWVGIIISALIFGAIHGIPIQAANAMIMGILIGMVYYITDSLMTIVVIHFLNNGFSYLQMLYFGKDDPARILFDTPSSYTILYILSFAIVVAFAVYAVGAIRKKRVSLSVDAQSNDN